MSTTPIDIRFTHNENGGTGRDCTLCGSGDRVYYAFNGSVQVPVQFPVRDPEETKPVPVHVDMCQGCEHAKPFHVVLEAIERQAYRDGNQEENE